MIFRLPQDIYQTAKVAKVLLLLEKGKGQEFKGKNLDEIQIEEDVFHHSDSEVDNEDEENSQYQEVTASASTESVIKNKTNFDMENTENSKQYGETKKQTFEEKNLYTNLKKKVEQQKYKVRKIDINLSKNKKNSGRIRWSDQEKKMVLEYFKEHIQKKITPRKEECNEFLKVNRGKMLNKDWVKIKTFVYNVFRQK